MPFTSSRYTATDAKLGGFTLDSETLGLIDLPSPLKPAPPQGWSESGANLYKGANPATPAIGDVRVHYTSLPAGTTISVLAQQSRDGFAPFTTGNGYQVQLARIGNAPAGLMIAEKKKAESTLTWILRGVGALVMFIGFSMFFAPLSTLASIIPFLGSLCARRNDGVRLCPDDTCNADHDRARLARLPADHRRRTAGSCGDHALRPVAVASRPHGSPCRSAGRGNSTSGARRPLSIEGDVRSAGEALCTDCGCFAAKSGGPGPSSNGHVPFGTTDFKSGASTSSATGP